MVVMDDQQREPSQGLGLGAIFEAVLLVAVEPITLDEMMKVSGASRQDCVTAIEVLIERYDAPDHGICVVQVAGGYRLMSKTEHFESLRIYANELHDTKLSPAALETLAIVAYQQPISRGRVSIIRGVNSDQVMRMLAIKGYIHPLGRDHVAGTAVLYATTPLFLERLGLDSLAELPDLASFAPSIEIAEAFEITLRNKN